MTEGWLARRLRVLRAERGLALTEAAKKAGVRYETISELERGVRHPQSRTLNKLAVAYGVPVEELVEEPVPLVETSTPTGLPEPSEEEVPIERSPSVKSWLRAVAAPRFAVTDAEYLREWLSPARERGVEGLVAEQNELTRELGIVVAALPDAPLPVPKIEVRRAYWRRSRLIDTELWRLIDAWLSGTEGDVEAPTDEEIERWRAELSSAGDPRRLAAP